MSSHRCIPRQHCPHRCADARNEDDPADAPSLLIQPVFDGRTREQERERKRDRHTDHKRDGQSPTVARPHPCTNPRERGPRGVFVGESAEFREDRRLREQPLKPTRQGAAIAPALRTPRQMPLRTTAHQVVPTSPAHRNAHLQELSPQRRAKAWQRRPEQRAEDDAKLSPHQQEPDHRGCVLVGRIYHQELADDDAPAKQNQRSGGEVRPDDPKLPRRSNDRNQLPTGPWEESELRQEAFQG